MKTAIPKQVPPGMRREPQHAQGLKPTLARHSCRPGKQFAGYNIFGGEQIVDGALVAIGVQNQITANATLVARRQHLVMSLRMVASCRCSNPWQRA
jgi:hypothetical protein